MTIEENKGLRLYNSFQNVAKELANVQGKHAEKLEKTEESEEILQGDGVTFEEGEEPSAHAKGRVNSIHHPEISATDNFDLAEKICDKLHSVNENLKKSFGDVKKYTGTTHAMLKAAGVNITATTKVFFNIFTLMQLILETAQKQRTAGREMRQAELLATTTSIERQADKQIQAATERYNAAIVSAAVSIGMGAASAVLSAYGGVKGASAANAKQGADKLSNMADEVLDASKKGGEELSDGVTDKANKISVELKQNITKDADALGNGLKDTGKVETPKPKIEVKLDPKTDPKVNPNVDSKVDPKVDPKVPDGNLDKDMDLHKAEKTVGDWLKGGGKGKPPPEVVKAAKTLKRASAAMDLQSKMGFIKQTTVKGTIEGLMGVGKGVGDIMAATMNLKAEMLQAEATREQVNQKFAEAATQDALEAMQTAQEVINTVIKAMLQILMSQVEMMKQMHFA